MITKSIQNDDLQVINGAEKIGISRGHIEREARAMAACFGGWGHLTKYERNAYRAEAAALAVEIYARKSK